MTPFSVACPSKMKAQLCRRWQEAGAALSTFTTDDSEVSAQFDHILDDTIARFVEEYRFCDEDIVQVFSNDWSAFFTPTVIDLLRTLANDQRAGVASADRLQFADVLPGRINRQRVNNAVNDVIGRLRAALAPAHLSSAVEGARTLTRDRPITRVPDPYSLYERGAERLLQLTASDPEVVRRISVLQARLFENISKARQYGDNSELRSDRFMIFDAFNPVAVNATGQSFAELCEFTRDGGAQHPREVPSIVAHNLPQRWYGQFVGRDVELSQLRSLLRPYPASRFHIVAIDGVGGVGKTVIALEAAYFYVQHVPHIPPEECFDAVIWTSAKRNILTPAAIVTREPQLRNIDDINNAFADVLDAPELKASDTARRSSLLRHILTQRRVLIVIDNLETVEDAKILAFLRDLPEPSKAIVTTRRTTIDGAMPLRIKGMGDVDGVKLINEECVKKGVVLDPATADELATRTEGVPLAIVWTIGKIALGHSPHRVLKHLAGAGEDYAQFVFRDAIDFLRHEKKTVAVKLVLALSLFPDGASRTAVGYVAGFKDADDIRDEGLSDLQTLSLINNDRGRFSMLALTREYAAAELAGDVAFRDEAIDRWFRWYLALTEQAGGGKLDLDASLLATLNIEHLNMLWVIKSAFTHERFDVYVRLLRGMGFYWIGRGYWQEYEERYDKARLLAPQPEDRIHFATRLIWLNVLRRNTDRAKKMLAFSRELIADYPDTYEEMRIEDYSGELAMELGDLVSAEIHLRRSAALAKQIGDRRGQFAALKYLGELYCRRNEPGIARDLLKEAEPFAAGTANDKWIRGLAHAAQLRGLIALVENSPSEAVTSFDGCQDYLRIWPDERLLTKVKHGLAFAYYAMGNSELALSELREAEGMYKRLGMSFLPAQQICDLWESRGLAAFWETL